MHLYLRYNRPQIRSSFPWGVLQCQDFFQQTYYQQNRIIDEVCFITNSCLRCPSAGSVVERLHHEAKKSGFISDRPHTFKISPKTIEGRGGILKISIFLQVMLRATFSQSNFFHPFLLQPLFVHSFYSFCDAVKWLVRAVEKNIFQSFFAQIFLYVNDFFVRQTRDREPESSETLQLNFEWINIRLIIDWLIRWYVVEWFNVLPLRQVSLKSSRVRCQQGNTVFCLKIKQGSHRGNDWCPFKKGKLWAVVVVKWSV